MTAGQINKPLADRLGYSNGMRVWFDGMPDSVRAQIFANEELILSEEEVPTPGIHAAHIFVTERRALAEKLEALRQLIDAGGFIWVSWPEQAAGQETDITEDTIREFVSCDGDLVDVNVCAIDEIWLGLKLMIRKEHR